MKTIQEWETSFSKIGYEDPSGSSMLRRLLKEVRDEALNEAEAVARRTDHEETADKIAALRSLP